MKDFSGRIAVVTGGGTGMGRELVRRLVAEGCNVAMCDVFAQAMAETKRLCEASRLPQGLRITTHIADVSDEAQVQRFREEVAERQDTDKIHLLFNNAGISGGGSMVAGSRDEWEKTFDVCWGGVYYSTRAFLPMLQKADEGHIVNTSSINGFWASIGPRIPHTAYCAAKFAVKGFTEALITDLRINAPHIKCSVVMPGHIGTSIVSNSRKIHADTESEVMDATEIAQARVRIASMGWTFQACRTKTSEKWRRSVPGVFARRLRRPRLPRRTSFLTGSKPTGGVFLSVKTPGGLMIWHANRRNALTRSISSRASQRRSAGACGKGILPTSEDPDQLTGVFAISLPA
jgi:NAD(P)-dependent dehydrogenase (short-subunit alcohol dehydrogenase family)